jgi:hypothetical protein
MNKRHKFPYLIRSVSRHGQVRWYFWKRPGPKIRVYGEFGSEEFKDNYWRAVAGEVIVKPVLKKAAAAPLDHVRLKVAVERAVIRAKKRAAEKGLQRDINFEWAMNQVVANNFKCEVTGIAFFDPAGDGHKIHPFAPSIDRIDPEMGYTKGNCRVVCCAVNVGLNSWGLDVFEKVSASFQRRMKSVA